MLKRKHVLGVALLLSAPRVGSPARPPWGSRKLGTALRFLESSASAACAFNLGALRGS
ncbi:hypothetical protein [Thiomonas sp.]